MKNVILIFCLLLSACATTQPPERAIWEPKDEFGREFKKKYLPNLQRLLADLQNIKDVGSILILVNKGSGPDSTSFYLSAWLRSYKVYNILRVNFEERAATASSEMIFAILKSLGKQKSCIDDPAISGVNVSIAWSAKQFLIESTGELEGISLFIPRDVLYNFLDFKITNQQLLERSLVLGFKGDQIMGRIEFNINKIF